LSYPHGHVDRNIDSVEDNTKVPVAAAPVREASIPRAPDSVPVAAPAPATAPTVVSGVKKTVVKTGSSKDKQGVVEENGLEGAWAAYRNRDYDKVLRICKSVPPGKERQYLIAKTVFGQFKQGEADGKDVMEAWFLVKSRSDLGSRWYVEADSVLSLFKR